MARLGTHTLLIGYVRQIPIAVSFGETEFYGMIRGASGLLGLADPCPSIRDCWRGHFKVLESRRLADISPSRNILILQCLLHQCLKYIASSPAVHVSPAVVVEFRAILSVLDYIASAPAVSTALALVMKLITPLVHAAPEPEAPTLASPISAVMKTGAGDRV